MAAKSKHYGDIAIWIGEVIDSCNHPLQEITARKLIRNFRNQLDRLDMDVHLRYSIIRPLELQLENKRWDRVEKRIK